MTDHPSEHCGQPDPSPPHAQHTFMRGVTVYRCPGSAIAQPVCCGCQGAHGPVVYRNFLEQPFCAHCCECSCGTHPCTAPQPEQPARHTVDTITSDALDKLYADVEFYEGFGGRMRDRAEVADVRQARAEQRAEQAEAAITRARSAAEYYLHDHEGGTDACAAAVLAAFDDPQEPTP